MEKLLEKISENFPGVIVIHNIPDFSIQYMSPRGLMQLGINLDEVRQLTADEYYQRYFNPDDAKDYEPKIRKLLEDNNNNEEITFFQQVRTGKNAEWVWHISRMRILTRDKKNNPLTSVLISFPVEDDRYFTSKINRLLEENAFLKNNLYKYHKLSNRELNVLQLLAQGKTIQEISESLFISSYTVDTHKKNIKKKLEANSSYELFKYASAFNLI